MASVSSAPSILLLDLTSIVDACDVTPPYAETRAIAASVLLERNHGPRAADPVDLHHDDRTRRAELRRCPVDARDHDTYDEPIQVTEEAAEAVAFLVARHVLGRVVYRRLRTRTGADYALRRPDDPDRDGFERLEISGIGAGAESTAHRLRDKITQLARFPDEPPGYAIVANFRDDPIEVMIARYAP